jgi:hypothetical protein
MITLARIVDAVKIISARAGDVTATRDPTHGDPHELTLCLQLKTIGVYDFHVPLAEVIDEAKAQCLKRAWAEGKEWSNTLAARLEEGARALLDAVAELRALRRSA